MRIESPEGAIGLAPRTLAPAPAALRGLRIGALDNGKPGAAWVLERAAAAVAARTGAEVVGLRRKRTAATPCEDALIEEIRRDADVVLTGTAD